MTVASRKENATAALFGAVLVGGLYADGWAHLNVGGLESFFTPWHAVLYGGFALLAGWLVGMVWRRRRLGGRWLRWVPMGYGWGFVGIAVFAAGGVLDMLWHLAFGVEAGIDALVSPTHLMLLTGGMLLVWSPLRAAMPRIPAGARPVHRWPEVVALATATALAGFFLSYVSVFADPGARHPLTSIPEGMPGHREAELPIIAGLAGYLVSTLLLVVPLSFLHRRARLPHGAVLVVVGAVAIPAAALSQMAFAVPAVAALVAASLVDLILAVRPDLPDAGLAALIPGLVWTGQLLGMAGDGLRWPVELWAGVVVLSVLLSVAVVRLNQPAAAGRTVDTERLPLASPMSSGPGKGP